jgi:hypothetical protein
LIIHLHTGLFTLSLRQHLCSLQAHCIDFLKGSFMYCSQEPIVVVDAPQAIVNIATQDPRVVINKRPDQWPRDVREQFRNNKDWRQAVGPHDGILVSPMLTDFVLDTKPRTPLAILLQKESGDVYVQVGTLFEIQTNKESRFTYGMNVAICLDEWKHRPPNISRTWGSSILAIARLPVMERPMMCYDPFGAIFISLLTH